MAIDDAGHDELAGSVDDRGVLGSLYRWTDFGDFAVLDKDRAVFDGAVRDGQDSCVLNEDDRAGFGRCENEGLERQHCGERCDRNNVFTNVHRASLWLWRRDERSASEELFVGLVPVKSIE